MSSLITDIAKEMVPVRQGLHRHPQTGNEETYAQGVIKAHLDRWGIDYEGGWGAGGTGFVATIQGKMTSSGKAIGLRADTDALNITEQTGLPYASENPGKMHACGHDGHMAIMLTVARHLSMTRNFNGTAKLIFQPAEEAMGGAKHMIENGLFEKHRMGSVHALHNWPTLPLGTIAIHPDRVMAASDYFDICITGKGGHAGTPHNCIDPMGIKDELKELFNRELRTKIDQFNVAILQPTYEMAGNPNSLTAIPTEAKMGGTIRTYDPDVRAFIKELITSRAEGFCRNRGASDYSHGYREGSTATVNDPDEAAISVIAARRVFDAESVLTREKAAMTSEDFGRMLDVVPGSFAWLGQGDPDQAESAYNYPLHSDRYNFNDGAIVPGAQYFAALVEEKLSLEM